MPKDTRPQLKDPKPMASETQFLIALGVLVASRIRGLNQELQQASDAWFEPRVDDDYEVDPAD